MPLRMPLRTLKKQIWLLVTCVMLAVSFNPDWNSSSIIWWGCIAVFGLSYAFYKEFKINIKFNIADMWMAGFIFFSALSVLYAAHKEATIDSLKTLMVMFFVCFLIGKEIKKQETLREMLWVTFFSLLIVVTYLYLYVDFNSFVLTRIGAADTGRWNVNSIGIMASIGILIGIFLFGDTTKIMKIFLIASILFLLYLDIITASRKAILMLPIGLCGMQLLNNPTKVIRNLLLIISSSLLVIYLIFEVPFFYELIGWRMEGMIALFKGNTLEVDSSALSRAMMIQSALTVFYDNPIFGVGLDNFRFFNAVRVTYAHNNFVEIAADLGILGLIAYYWIFVYIVFDYLKKYKKHSKMRTFLFLVVVVYFINHIGMVTILEMLQSIFVCLYISCSRVYGFD